MNYLINNIIIYDNHQGLLYTDDVNNAIKLTTTLNRLLLVLIQNNNEILDRETLLRRVWEDHNQVVSDNNLNSSISVLRRHLSSFWNGEIITTIPKIGMKFSAELKFEGSENLPSQDIVSLNSDIESEPAAIVKPETETKSVIAKKSYILNNRYLEVALIGIIIFCLIYLFKSYFFANKVEYPEVGRIDQCSIRYINSYHKPDTTTVSFTILQEKLTKLNINCQKPATIFYYNVGTLTHNKNIHDDFLFISYCPSAPKDSATVSCENFYVK